METKKEIEKQIITFLGITTFITTVVFVWLFNDKENYRTIGMIMMFVPGISALLTSLITRDKISNYGWKLGKLKYLGWAYIIPLIVALISYGIYWLGGFGEFTSEEVINYRWAKYLGFDLPAPFLAGFVGKAVLATLIGCILTFGEELGWTGYLTPKLLKISSIPETSIMVGIYWSVWHYPAIIGGIYGWSAPLWFALLAFTISCIGLSFVRTVLVYKSNSLWTGVILHASNNLILMSLFWEMTVKNEYTSYFVNETGMLEALVFISVAVLFWKYFSIKKMKAEF